MSATSGSTVSPMQYGQVPGVDKPVSRLVLGTMMLASDRLQESFDLLDGAYALGCNTFDTAHIYSGGDCERVFGRWIAERGLRDKVVIIGKGAHPNADRNRVTPFDIAADVHDSLARMKVDCIDLYLLHRDDLTLPVGPMVEALNELQRAGHIGAFGGSNWTAARIAEANAYAAGRGLTPMVASSPNYSLAVPRELPWPGCVSVSGDAGEADRQWYQQHKMPLFCWSSLGGGFLTGRYRRDNLESFAEAGYFEKLVLRCYCTDENFDRLDRAEAAARRLGLTIPQIAMAWLMQQPEHVFALVGCRTAEEFGENVAALAVTEKLDLQA